MSNLPPLPLDTDAYLSDTGHLSTTQHGAYMLLLMAIWRSKDGWLSGDDSFLARASRQSLDKWRKMAPVIRALLIAKDGKVTQKRCKKIKDLTPPASALAQSPSIVSKSLKNKGAIPKTAKNVDFLQNDTLSLLPLDSEIQEKEERESGRKKAKRTSLPVDWVLSQQGRAFAMDAGYNHSACDRMASAFFNYHRSRGSLMADWEAAWRTWVNNETRFNHRGGKNGTRSKSALDAFERLFGSDEGPTHQASGESFVELLPQRRIL